MILFVLTAAALTLFCVALVVWPLVRTDGTPRSRTDVRDSDVYRAQLSELRADVSRGTLAEAEAESARAEIGRRLIRAEARDGSGTAKGTGRRLVALAVAVAIFVPAGAGLIYASTGSPSLPDVPLAARATPDAEIERMMAAAEERLRRDPSDGRGWEVMAPIYLRTGAPEKAAEAFGNAIELLGATPARQVGLGEALVQAADGEVTADARAAFDAALVGDPELLAARFYVALDLSQEASPDAAAAWRNLIEDSPADAPWLDMARAAEAQALAPVDTANGPSAADVERAAALSPADRGAMIEGMVSGLAARLEENPNDPEGWQRLIRAYAVLGDRAALDRAAADARDALSEGSAGRAAIEALIASLREGEASR